MSWRWNRSSRAIGKGVPNSYGVSSFGRGHAMLMRKKIRKKSLLPLCAGGRSPDLESEQTLPNSVFLW